MGCTLSRVRSEPESGPPTVGHRDSLRAETRNSAWAAAQADRDFKFRAAESVTVVTVAATVTLPLALNLNLKLPPRP